MEAIQSTSAVRKDQVPTFTGNKNSIERTTNFVDAVKAYILTFDRDAHHSEEDKCQLFQTFLCSGENTWFCVCKKENEDDGALPTVNNVYKLFLNQFYLNNIVNPTCGELNKIRLDGSLNEINIKIPVQRNRRAWEAKHHTKNTSCYAVPCVDAMETELVKSSPPQFQPFKASEIMKLNTFMRTPLEKQFDQEGILRLVIKKYYATCLYEPNKGLSPDHGEPQLQDRIRGQHQTKDLAPLTNDLDRIANPLQILSSSPHPPSAPIKSAAHDSIDKCVIKSFPSIAPPLPFLTKGGYVPQLLEFTLPDTFIRPTNEADLAKLDHYVAGQDAIWKIVAQKMNDARNRFTREVNVSLVHKNYLVGHKFLLNLYRIKILLRLILPRKLVPSWKGPFTVLARGTTPDTYMPDLGTSSIAELYTFLHVSILKLYLDPTTSMYRKDM
ncbi:hypothetical protein BJ085DRAFT_39273 [Dimargaris cristalligena]|uniref:Uncharacterized protein n=1 Tax=Dimargaris cristalligena TaxID=215637 RepID=A0A4P9ZLD2_9FUNG|nr:hypothetical protein BJ085DRAFT_39273 [Dimargaris cristalligena]|eukprot:RKP33943.1 hypothetical protein BJ085DRAFT_39273 [Dimargaris cristalligena]